MGGKWSLLGNYEVSYRGRKTTQIVSNELGLMISVESAVNLYLRRKTLATLTSRKLLKISFSGTVSENTDPMF